MLGLTIIRLYIEGPTAVCVFFVITGYVSSIKGFRLMTTNQHSELMQTLSSSLFRKWFRLFLPTLFIMAIIAMATQLGCFEYTRPMMAHSTRMIPPGTPMKPNLKRNKHAKTQFLYLLKEFWQVADIFNSPQYFPNQNDSIRVSWYFASVPVSRWVGQISDIRPACGTSTHHHRTRHLEPIGSTTILSRSRHRST